MPVEEQSVPVTESSARAELSQENSTVLPLQNATLQDSKVAASVVPVDDNETGVVHLEQIDTVKDQGGEALVEQAKALVEQAYDTRPLEDSNTQVEKTNDIPPDEVDVDALLQAVLLDLPNNSSLMEVKDLMSEVEASVVALNKSVTTTSGSAAEVIPLQEEIRKAKMAETKQQTKPHPKKDKKRKSGDSGNQSISNSLRTLPVEQQVATLISKYDELVDDNRRLQTTVKAIQRQAQVLQKEKEQMESEHTKVILTKSRLESLCRELQRQNKAIKDENLTRLREEEDRRKEVSAKFNSTLSEISNLMKENSDKNSQLRDENQDMATRLQELIKQYQERETYVEKMMKQKDLQCQLVEAKMAKLQIEVTEEKEKMLVEKKGLLEEIASYQNKTQQMSMNEIALRTQLNSYMEKYEDFQSTLDRSNKIFNNFKKEMDEMTKKIKKLEKETKTWKERWEGANKALLDMVTERTELEKKLETQTKQNAQLQNLCRALQQQVRDLRKGKGSEISESSLTLEDDQLPIGPSSEETGEQPDTATTNQLPQIPAAACESNPEKLASDATSSSVYKVECLHPTDDMEEEVVSGTSPVITQASEVTSVSVKEPENQVSADAMEDEEACENNKDNSSTEATPSALVNGLENEISASTIEKVVPTDSVGESIVADYDDVD